MDSACDCNQAAFVQAAGDELSQSPPCRDINEVGVIAALFIFEVSVHGQRKARHGRVACRVTNFGITG